MKRLFFLVYVCIGVVILFQASRIIATVFEKRLLLYPVQTEVKNSAGQAYRPFDGGDYEIALFSSPLFSVKELNTEIPQTEESETPDSPLLKRYELNGVVIIPKNRSIALIRRVRERESQPYRKGEMIDNLEIVKIERFRVILSDGLSTMALPMYYKQKTSQVRDQQETVIRGENSDTYANAKQLRKVLSRSDVENKVFSKVNQILTQIAISPYMVNGQMEGLRLIRVPNESIVYELGGRSGDVIKRVNGHELKKVEQMYKLWDNIKDDAFINVDLERKSQLYTYSFEIRE
jgi:type II secretion system protein C